MSSSYRSILKATSLTGGAQVGKILVKLVRSKALAIILGPAGIGFIGLIQSTMQVVTSIFGMGLSFSAVRSIAEVGQSREKVASIYRVVRFWLFVTGFTGALFTFFTSGWLSEITFGDRENQYIFQWLSITVLFTQISAGQISVLQGLRKIKDMALAQVSGAFIGLIISVPVYFIYGLNGVIAALILLSLSNLIRSAYFLQKQKIPTVKVTWKYILVQGKPLFSLGLVGLLNGLSATLAGFAIRALLRNFSGDTFYIGIYQAAWVIGVTYLDLIFNAMSGDYYPRLTNIKDDWKATNRAIHEQRNIALWIGIPLLTVLIVYSPWIVTLLYSKEFLQAASVISIISIGIFFKLLVWPIGFLLIVNKRNRIFLVVQILWQVIFLTTFYLLYNSFGIVSVGIGFTIAYLLHLVIVWTISKKLFEKLNTSPEGWLQISLATLFVMSAALTRFTLQGIWVYLVGTVIILSSAYYSFYQLRPIIWK